jgi:catechol 2,3-dioxygenase-like lactoylglutathione lyase family enzyme
MTANFDRRGFLGALPALALVPRLLAQSDGVAIRVRGLSQLTLTVADVKRSLVFYQSLFGMPIQARQGSTVFLRVGAGPQFVALRQAAAGEAPSISSFGMGVENFSVDRVTQILKERGVTPVAAEATVVVTEPSGIVFQLHDVSYCGGAGPLGSVCSTVEPAPATGLFAVRDLSHFTINVSDEPRTVAFLRDLIGMPVQVRQGAAPAYGVGPGVHFLMFIGAGPGRGGAPARPSRIDHGCLSMDGFNPDAVTKTLAGYGITPQATQSRQPLVTYISLRMPNRGGAEGGTPELYFTDPDGLAIQLQDVTYCGGGGFLGDACPRL